MLTILMIEDNPNEMIYCENTIQKILTECNILKAASAEEALYLLHANKIDIFFIDVELPGMSGFQLAEEIRKDLSYLTTTIVFLTGYHADHLEIHRKYHHYEYIEKPYSLESLKERVGSMLIGLNMQKEKTAIPPTDKKKRMVLIETKTETFFIDFDEILFLETEGRKLKLHTRQKLITEVNGKIDSFIKELNHPLFVQCHRSYAVNINNITAIKNINRRLWAACFFEYENNCFISQTYFEGIYQQYLKSNEK